MGLKYVADFETTTSIDDCRVWAWGCCSIDDVEDFHHGNNIDSFFNWVIGQKDNLTLYFHNLKFDVEFIFYYLFRNGYKYMSNKNESYSFKTLITDKNLFYSVEIYFKVKGKKVHKLTLYDSLKIIPLSVSQIAKDFKLQESKLEIDYHKERKVNYIPTKHEIEYLKNDCLIIAKALDFLFQQCLDKMTLASNAFKDYKNIITEKYFEKMFPIPNYDSDIRASYKGGFTYLNPKFKNKIVKNGMVFDVNSLYPSVMYFEKMPYGEPIFFSGEYEKDNLYPLYIQSFVCNFELKKGYIPTIQLKNNLSFIPTEYVENSNGEDVALCLTNVDINLFFEHYNVYNIFYCGGYKFRCTDTMFKEYIDKWSKNKIEAKKEGNFALYTLSKLMLNSLYGRFAINPNVRGKHPEYNIENDLVNYVNDKWEERKPIYLPIGTFITAYARYKTITSAQKLYNRFIYADTDSLHLTGQEIPKELEIDDTKLGYWKHECNFDKAKFLRAKSYIEYFNKELHVTCAGMPKECHELVTFKNFKVGAKYGGKLQQKRVRGGIVLKTIDFTIKG